jgi:hypothetical protein
VRNPCADCGTPTSNGTRCEKHDRDDERRNAKTVDHGVKRSHFQRLRLRRIELADAHCELRVDERCTVTATTVHLDPALEGDHDAATIDDVRAACAHCHGVVDGGRASGGRGRPIFETRHSPGTGSIFPRTGLEASAKPPRPIVIA